MVYTLALKFGDEAWRLKQREYHHDIKMPNAFVTALCGVF